MTKARLIVFDCDGTLVDSAHIIIQAMAAAWQSHGLLPPPACAMRQNIGRSLEQAIVTLAHDQDQKTQATLMEAFRDHYHAARGASHDMEPLYDGCEAVLRTLAAAEDIYLGVATGKGRRGLALTLETHGIASLFSVLKTADDGPSKPHPKILLDAMKDLGVLPGNTIMIGDTIFDMALAARAGTGAIGVAWGYHAASELKTAGADRIAETYSEIPDLIDSMRGK